MTQFTLIAYRPDHDDYCRGCHVGGSSSDLRVFYGTDKAEIISKITDLMIENHDESEFGTFEFTIVIDGIPYSNEDAPLWLSEIEEGHQESYDDNEALMYEIINAAGSAKEEALKQQRDIQKRIAEAEAARKKKADEKAREEHDRKEYERLRNKFEATQVASY